MDKMIDSLRPSRYIDDFIKKHDQWVHSQASKLNVSLGFITTQTPLHLPYYDKQTIISHEKKILDQIETKIINLSRDYHVSYSKLIKNTKISFINNLAVLKGKNHLFIDNNQDERMLVKFQETPSSIANDINNNFHYIHSSRPDSFVDYGLFIDDDKVPYANVSFSKCKRNYQLLALNKAISANLSLSVCGNDSRIRI